MARMRSLESEQRQFRQRCLLGLCDLTACPVWSADMFRTKAPVKSHDTTLGRTTSSVEDWLRSDVDLFLVARHSEIFLTLPNVSWSSPFVFLTMGSQTTVPEALYWVILGTKANRQICTSPICPPNSYVWKTVMYVCTKGKMFGQNNQWAFNGNTCVCMSGEGWRRTQWLQWWKPCPRVKI